MVKLVKYEAARKALEEAKSIDEVKDIRDKAEAMRAYARQAKDNEMMFWAAELKLRAERKAGRLLLELGLSSGRPSKSSHGGRISKYGITWNQSSRWQREASLSEGDFEVWLSAHRGESIPTSAGLRNHIKRQNAQQDSGPHRTDATADLAVLAESGAKFSAICADPPWSFKVYSGKGKSRSAESHYDTMTQEDIEALGEHVKGLSDKNCALFLWAVMPQLPEAFRVIEAWGFAYKTCAFNWVKRNRSGSGFFMGMGYWTRSNAELCLLATKGSPQRLAMNVEQLIVSPVGEHSSKPEEAKDRIERLVNGPYLELFARRKRHGWTVWGNDIRDDLFSPEVAAE